MRAYQPLLCSQNPSGDGVCRLHVAVCGSALTPPLIPRLFDSTRSYPIGYN
jgi:hypothetical protein